jgi:hypothetical protein
MINLDYRRLDDADFGRHVFLHGLLEVFPIHRRYFRI